MQKLETKKPIHWLIVTNTVSLWIKERSLDIQNNNWRFWQTEDQKTQQDFNIAFLFVGSENFFYSHLSIVLSLITVRSSVFSVAAVFNVISFRSPASCPSLRKKNNYEKHDYFKLANKSFIQLNGVLVNKTSLVVKAIGYLSEPINVFLLANFV